MDAEVHTLTDTVAKADTDTLDDFEAKAVVELFAYSV